MPKATSEGGSAAQDTSKAPGSASAGSDGSMGAAGASASTDGAGEAGGTSGTDGAAGASGPANAAGAGGASGAGADGAGADTAAAKQEEVERTYPRRVLVKSHATVVLVEPVTGAFLQPGAQFRMQVTSPEHEERAMASLADLLARNNQRKDALEFEDVPQ